MNNTPGKLAYAESEHEPNRFTIGADGKWLMSIQHNGEPLVETQRENMRRLVAAWNACEGSSTEWLEFQSSVERAYQAGPPEPLETRYATELLKGVRLLDACKLWLSDDLDDGMFADTLRLIIAKNTP